MSDFEDKIHEEIEDTPTLEEQQKIEAIQIATFVPPAKKEEPKPVSVWSIFGSIFSGDTKALEQIVGAAAIGTQSALPKFDIAKFLYIEKSVNINNISGKNAYVIISSNPIKTVSSVAVNAGAGGVEAGVDIKFEEKGDYEVQKISISNNTSSRCCLDNTQFRCTLFFNIDGIWKRSWENRRFDGRRFNINILEKHVEAALKKGDIPDF
jgi:hypothetical protein